MRWVKVSPPLAPKVKNLNSEQSDHMCWASLLLLLLYFWLSINAVQRRGRAAEQEPGKLLLSITHASLSPPFTPPAANWLHSPPLSLRLADNCVIWPYRGIWNGVVRHHPPLPHPLPPPKRYANSFRSWRFDKLDCSSWKTSFKREAAAAAAAADPFPSSHPSSILPSPPLSPLFSIPSPSLFVAICRASPLQIEKRLLAHDNIGSRGALKKTRGAKKKEETSASLF